MYYDNLDYTIIECTVYVCPIVEDLWLVKVTKYFLRGRKQKNIIVDG